MTNSILSLRSLLRGSLVLLIGLCMTHPLISTPLSAQITAANIGMKGGLNVSNFHGQAIGEAESLNTTTLGVFLQLDFGGAFSFQPEVNYSKRGAKEEALLGAVTEGVWAYNYFDVVALLEYRLGSRRSSPSLSLFTGPVVAFLGSAQATGVGPEGMHSACAGCVVELMSPPVAIQVQHETKGVDVGGTIGMGIDFGTGSTKLVLDVRYTRMMSEFDEAPYDDVYSRKHNALSFQAGISLSPSAWARVPTRRSLENPPEQSIVIVERITQENIAARGEGLSVYDLIRLERPAWLNGGELLVTLFVDGERWDTLFLDGESWTESVQLLRDRPVTDVHEIRRIGAGAEGVYAGQGVVIELISR